MNQIQEIALLLIFTLISNAAFTFVILSQTDLIKNQIKDLKSRLVND